MIDITKMVTPIDPGENKVSARVGFVADGGKLYPEMSAEILAMLEAGKGPDKLLNLDGTPNPLFTYWIEARVLGAGAFKTALVPFSECDKLSAQEKAQRNGALEVCRKWFTEILHQSVKNQPMYLRITTDEAKTFKLCK